MKGKTLKWCVDIETFTLAEATRGVSKQLRLGVEQCPYFWYFDKASGEDVRLKHDEQLAVMWEQYSGEMKLSLIVAVIEKLGYKGDRVEPVALALGPADDASLIGSQERPQTPSQHATAHAIVEAIGTCDSSATQDMQQAEASTDPGPSKEARAQEPDDPFDNDEEYVGVDEERMYDVGAGVTIMPEVTPSVFEGMEEREDMAGLEEEFVMQQEAEVTDHDPDVHIHQDLEHPDIRKGAKFPDMTTFRKAIRHYAVIRDFQFGELKTNPTRFIASCAHPECNWRVRVSRLPDGHTIMV